MSNSAYKAAGVDVEAGYRAVELMKSHVARTVTSGVLSGIGGFGGLFELPSGYDTPVLVSGTDGVGTKLKLAFILNKHDTVGQDCVAMCVNDIICSGAKPLFFLDYIACGKNEPERIADIVKGIADGCVLAGCALVGGETAEMPGFYPADEYDMAGFSVGIVEKSRIVDNSTVSAGDVLIALPSSGVHSNGFSLIRKVFNIGEDNEKNSERLAIYSEELSSTIGEALLTPTRIYVKPMLELLKKVNVKAISHITGGGFYENIPRMLPKGVRAKIDAASFTVPPIFNIIAASGKISERDMYNTFNMGLGMMFAVAKGDADLAVATLAATGETAYVVGEVVAGDEGVNIL
ncbi:MAG: phosphoribosylformylglycinamidine cyclo-ligase [Oscillospiraceae bacterium]|nr:phosphoribosylformylglycinamidine cyclo-ligase [Oscillospiraceae bacterium]